MAYLYSVHKAAFPLCSHFPIRRGKGSCANIQEERRKFPASSQATIYFTLVSLLIALFLTKTTHTKSVFPITNGIPAAQQNAILASRYCCCCWAQRADYVYSPTRTDATYIRYHGWLDSLSQESTGNKKHKKEGKWNTAANFTIMVNPFFICHGQMESSIIIFESHLHYRDNTTFYSM